MPARNPDLDPLRERIVKYINEHASGVFWVRDVFDAMNVMRTDMQKPEEKCIDCMIRSLKKQGYIHCCEKRGNHRQYITLKRIVFADVIMS